MKRKPFVFLCSLLLVFVFLIMAYPATAVSVSTADEKLTVAFRTPAIPADTNQTVDLTKYNVEFNASSLVSADEITWSSDDITITDNKVKPTSKGVYKIIATSDSSTKNVYLVVKAPSDTEYVLYADDFNTNTLSNYSTSGNCSIADGKLVLNSKSGKDAYVTIPGWLKDFGNYSISTSVNIQEANNDSRWVSLMYRINGVGYPFFQMAVRQNATLANGVELAHNIDGSTWGYHFKGSYKEALSPSSFYTLGLNVYDNKATVSINGTLCGTSGALTEIDNGTVGLRSNGCIANLDDLKITARFDQKGMPADHVDIRELTSGMTLAPSMIYEIKSKADLDGILTNSPAVAIMTLNKSGSIVASNGSTICSIADAVDKLDGKVIPAIKPDRSCDTDSLNSIIKALLLKDLFIVSSDTAQIKAVRAEHKNVLGIYDLSDKDLSGAKLIDIRSGALSAGAKICILPATLASQANTEFLNTLGVTVWYKAAQSNKTELFALVTAGANGVISSDRKLLEEVIASPIFKNNSIIRPVGIIGHRGTPALAPENTVAGSVLAAKNGANIIENDIYLTTDGVLVVMHDSTIDRTTNGTGNVESFSYEQLCKYYVDCAPTTSESKYGKITESQPIPTLEDYFVKFKGTDTFMFIEIKSSKHEELASALKRLVDKYEIADQCGVIAFNQSAVTAIRKAIPEISVGYLCSDSSLSVIAANTSRLESSYNPDQSKVTPALVKDLAARGIFTWPWTIRDSAKFDQFFLMGVGGITTDNSYLAKNYLKRIYTERKEYSLKTGEVIDLNVIAQTYGAVSSTDLSNSTYTTNGAEMLLIEGEDMLIHTGSRLTAKSAGEYTVLFRLSFKLNNNQTAYVYSEPVTIKVTAPTTENTDPEDPGQTPGQTPEQKPGQTTGTAENTENEGGSCFSSISATCAISVIAVLAAGIGFKKKDD